MCKLLPPPASGTPLWKPPPSTVTGAPGRGWSHRSGLSHGAQWAGQGDSRWPDVAGAFPALDSPQVLLGPLHVLGTRLDVPLGAFWPYLLALASSTWACGQAGWSCRPPPPPARASPAAAGGPWAPCASSPGAALSSAGFAEHLLTCPCLTLLLSLAHQPEASLRGAEAGRKGPRSDGGLGWRPSCQSHPRGAAFHGTWPHTRVAIVCCWNFVLISTGSRSSPHICRASRRWGQVRRLRS